MSLQAGVALRDVTPEKPVFLVGYPHVARTSTGIHDPLYAAALCLTDGAETVLSIAVDILFVPHEIADHCRTAIRGRTGIPEKNILISATHTHSGPNTADILAWRDDPIVPPPDPDYLDLFRRGIIHAAVAAHDELTPALLAVATADGTGVGGNRLAPDGVADPEVGLLFLQEKETRRPLALQMVYSMHPTVLHEDSTLISADFPAYTRRHLTERFPSLGILYHTGPSGNQSPRYHVSGQTFAEAERLGRKLGAAVLTALENLQPGDFRDDITLAAGQEFVELPPRQFCSVSEAEQLLAQARADYESLQRQGAPHGPVRTAECTVFGAEERVTLARAQAGGELDAIRRRYSPVEVQVIRVGQTSLVGLRGECFVEYALDIKRRAPGRAFVISLANGELQGYIVTPDATGYEADMSLFLPEAGRLMADAAVDLTHQLAERSND